MNREELKQMVQTFIELGAPVYNDNCNKKGEVTHIFINNGGRLVPVNLQAVDNNGKFDKHAVTPSEIACMVANNNLRTIENKDELISAIQGSDFASSSQIILNMLPEHIIERNLYIQENVLEANMIKNEDMLKVVNESIKDIKDAVRCEERE